MWKSQNPDEIVLETVVIRAFMAFLQSRVEILKKHVRYQSFWPGPVSPLFLIAVMFLMKDSLMETFNQNFNKMPLYTWRIIIDPSGLIEVFHQ